MASSASPIDISLSPRFSSHSPRNQTSNLTFALQEAGATGIQPAEPAIDTRQDAGRLSVGGRNDSISVGGSSYFGTGARPISTGQKQRRESSTGSFVAGMSWGGMSVGSFIRDDVMMAGTSPNMFAQSPSFHSSSYLPKMEANFLRDYECCGIKLDSLHELLQHFEENHSHASSQIAHRTSSSSQGGRKSSFGDRGSQTLGQGQASPNSFQRQPPPTSGSASGFNKTQLSTVQDMDSLEDMEMDEPATPMPSTVQPAQQQPQPFASQNIGLTSLDTPLANTINAQQAFRQSAPTTPATTQPFTLFNNPTVSSVNTPALSTQSMQQAQNRATPDSSLPGTPGEIDPNFMQNYDMFMAANNGQMIPDDFTLGSGIGFGLSNFDDMTIDEPAKRLFSKQNGLNQQQLQYAVKNGQIPMDSEFAKRMREQQLVSGVGGPVIGFPEPEVKPFRCPVIGCEKAYKNQNGLKYHKQHGHQNQKLQANDDGTFSIVDPVTSIPYPGTIGMEKEKPYRCEVCGKRYKNLNGLKYHRAHSPPCNPELQMNKMTGMGLQGVNPNANIAGAGLTGFGEGSNF